MYFLAAYLREKKYFFSAFAKILLRTLEMIITKIAYSQFLLAIAWTLQNIVHLLREWLLLKKYLIHFHVLFIQMILWELKFLGAFLNSILFYQQNLFHTNLKDQVSYVTATGLVPTNPLSINKRSTNLIKWLSVRLESKWLWVRFSLQ